MTSVANGSEQPRQAQYVRLVVDTIPTLAWSARSDGSADFFNQRWLDYTGLSTEQARDGGWTVALHSDDLNGLVDYWRSVLAFGEPGEIEGRLRRFDGVYRRFLFRATPSFDRRLHHVCRIALRAYAHHGTPIKRFSPSGRSMCMNCG